MITVLSLIALSGAISALTKGRNGFMAWGAFMIIATPWLFLSFIVWALWNLVLPIGIAYPACLVITAALYALFKFYQKFA